MTIYACVTIDLGVKNRAMARGRGGLVGGGRCLPCGAGIINIINEKKIVFIINTWTDDNDDLNVPLFISVTTYRQAVHVKCRPLSRGRKK